MALITDALEGLTPATVVRARDFLAGKTRGWRAAIPLAGPAVVVSIAYTDPGNFATNIQAGSRYGYSLLWTVLGASLVAMLFQALSARIGIATGKNLPELCREHFPKSVVLPMWIVSEIAAIATDLAELLGGAIAFALLLHVPLLIGMLLTAAFSFAILACDRWGFRPVEVAVALLVLTIGVCYLVEVAIAPPHWSAAAYDALVPHIPNNGALILAVGIVGATVMPHAIYLHSGLTQNRILPATEQERARLITFSNRESVLALAFAGLINMAMLAMAATVFHGGHSGISDIANAYRTLFPLLGSAAALVFLTALLASGISSSTVGTMAGQMIMQGFAGFAIPVWVRRALTMCPPLIVVLLGANPTWCLILSQVVLSLTLPLPMVALLLIVRRREIMGRHVVPPYVFALAAAAAAIVLFLNGLLLWQQLQ